MIIREYEYEKDRPWNCQERFISMTDHDNPWQRYKNKLFGISYSNFSMIDRMIKDTIHEEDNAFSFEFEINGGRFVHVSSKWYKPLCEESIIVTSL